MTQHERDPESKGQTLTLNDLYEAEDEIPAHPDNQYEIAEGVIVGMKKPTLRVQEAFEEADKPVQNLYKDQGNDRTAVPPRPDEKQGSEMESTTEDELRSGFDLKTLQQTVRKVAITQAGIILELPEDLDTGDIYATMAVVARAHFMQLADGIGTALRVSSPASVKAQG